MKITNQPTTGNTMHQDLYTAHDTHVEHSTIDTIPSAWDDSNHVVDTLPTHLPNPSEYRSEVAVMFDFLSHLTDGWVLTGSTKQLVDWARNELVRGGRTPFYHECIKELVKMYKGGE